MSEQEKQTQNNDQLMIIPAHYLLYVAGAGLLIALSVGLMQPEFNVVGWSGLALTLLALLGWALLAPDQLKAVLTGRGARYGGTAFVVTVVFIVALVAVYALVRDQGWRVDFSQGNNFSLTEEAISVINTLAADPTTPEINVLLFYGSTQGGVRDRAEVLLDDYVSASGGKISYEFIDPDRNPNLLSNYGAQPGQVAVVPVRDGALSPENAEVLPALTQDELTNTIISVSSSGDFRAFYLTVEDGVDFADGSPSGGTSLDSVLTEVFGWTTQSVGLVELSNPDADLLNSGADGEVLVIPGGSQPLPDDQLALITAYIDAGGSVAIFVGTNREGGESLATADNFADYLWENFGLRPSNDTIFDLQSSVQSPFNIAAGDFGQHYTSEAFIEGDALVFSLAHSIEVAEEAPANVTVTEIVRSSSSAYQKSGLDYSVELTDADISQAEDDSIGPFVLGASAINNDTGAQVIVFGSDSLLYNQYEALAAFGIRNIDGALRAIAWSSGFSDFFESIPRVFSQPTAQDAPLFATDQQLRQINFIAVFVLPFGLLALGILVWWTGREREAAAQEKGA